MNCKVLARGLFLLLLVSLLAQNALAADGDMKAAEIAILVMSAVITGVTLLFFLSAVIYYARSG